MACTISAAEIKRVKALGFLNNKGTDLFNARVITVNGKITAQQTAVLAQAAEKFGNGEVEFTTRLTVEIGGSFDDIPAFQEFIAPAGLITGGTGSGTTGGFLQGNDLPVWSLRYVCFERKKFTSVFIWATTPSNFHINLKSHVAAAPIIVSNLH